MIHLCFATGSGIYLGRAWRAGPQMVYAYSSMTKVVKPAGWSDDNHPEHDKNVAYKEYKCMSPGSSTYNKRNLSKELTDKQVKPFTSLGCIQASSCSSGCYSRRPATNLPIYVPVGITASVCLPISTEFLDIE